MVLMRLQARAPQFSTADNPTAKEARFLTRFLTFAYLPVVNVWLLLCPSVLSFDWGMDSIPRISNVQDPRNLLTVVFYLALCILVRQCLVSLWKQNGISIIFRYISVEEKGKHCPCSVCHQIGSELHSASCRSSNNNNVMNVHSCVCLRLLNRASQKAPSRCRTREAGVTSLLALGFLTLPFLPATNLFFYVGFVIAERVLYIPSAGFCLMLGLGAAKLWNVTKHRSVTTVGLVILLVAFGGRTVQRNKDWVNEEALYRSALPVNSPKG